MQHIGFSDMSRVLSIIVHCHITSNVYEKAKTTEIIADEKVKFLKAVLKKINNLTSGKWKALSNPKTDKNIAIKSADKWSVVAV